ncbi:Putative P-loop containing nucleoside triphosphate hydrolase [Septoria linicola]|uniref:P-loop containing nucleoside triphosphate hydrolase n=1 Tax=Septoria linicola TaxID=215465 RepID=A0A9Q9AZM5_9PEZI|nr:putative P-loop containing nucleoside triphosphate hydrolase [Septoria linicola]USW54943.1 Putative P-loop containing nucleoside triphosphate hydrolase [Septoria linicola]
MKSDTITEADDAATADTIHVAGSAHAAADALATGNDEDEGLYVEAPAYDPELAQLPGRSERLCEGVRSIVPSTLYEHPTFQHLMLKLSNAMTCPTSYKLRINLVGRSGAGKSSHLNCLLDRPGLARANALGAGCTHVPTTYESAFPHQTKPFAVRVEFFNLNEVRKRMAHMLHSWIAANIEDDLADLLEEDKLEVKEGEQSALDNFCALFCTQKQISTREAAIAYLKVAQNRPEEKVLDQLVGWCEELLPVETEADTNKHRQKACYRYSVLHFEAESLTELHQGLDSYAFSDPTLTKPSLWPLVKLIRIGLSGVSILQYATFTDWPGYGDTNVFRANASSERMSDCDEIWTISPIDRVCTEPTVWRNIERYNAAASCHIVCTQIDVKCDDDDAQEMAANDVVLRDEHRRLMREDKSLREELRGMEKEFEEREELDDRGSRATTGGKRQKLSDAAIEENKEKLWALRSKTRALEKRAKQSKQERRQLIVDMRKGYFRTKLREKVTTTGLLDANIKIFCVSNEHYMGRKDVKDVFGPLLTLEGTGIPEIRRHILTTVAPEIMKSRNEYVNHTLAAVVHGIRIVVQPEELKDSSGMLLGIQDRQLGLQQHKQVFLAEIEHAIQEYFVKPMSKARKECTATAMGIIKEKRNWRAPSLRAFLRHDGCYKTFAIGREVWNEQFLLPAAPILLANWEKYVQAWNRTFDKLQKALREEVLSILQLARKRAGKRTPKATDSRLEDLAQAQWNGVKTLGEKIGVDSAKKFESIKIAATQAGDEDVEAYIDVILEEAYEECRSVTGHGYRIKVLDTLETHFKRGGKASPFMLLGAKIADALEADADLRADLLINKVSLILEDIEKWLQGALFKEEDDDAEVQAIKKELAKYLPGVQEEFEDLQQMLVMIDQRYGNEE